MAEFLRLPRMSDTMEEGVIASIAIKVGDTLNPGDLIGEVETDKATVDLDYMDDAVLAKILVPEGTSDVPVQSPIAILVEDVADVSFFASATADDYADASSETEAATAEPAAAEPAATEPDDRSSGFSRW